MPERTPEGASAQHGRDPVLGYEFSGVTPEAAGADDPGPGRPIGTLLDPDAPGSAPLPLVPDDPSDEPLTVGPQALQGVEYLPVYQQAHWVHATSQCWLRESVWRRLDVASASLPAGFGICVWDGWRDPHLQSLLYADAYGEPGLEPGFVNPPSPDPATPAPHATGGTIDLTLSWRGVPLLLGTGFDAFVPSARADAFERVPDDGPADQVTVRNLRRLLRWAMAEAGFVVLASEWWHFEHGTRLWAAVRQDVPRFGAVRPD